MSGTEIDLQTRFRALGNIFRAQHFAWRETVRRRFPDAAIADVLQTMWEIAGEETAEAFLPGIDRKRPLPGQVADAIARSSQCMGQDATSEHGDDEVEAYVSQKRCPWLEWHTRHDLVAEDRPGCDAWYAGILERVNDRLGTSLAVETCSCLPEGDGICQRRIYVSGRLTGFQDW